MNEHEILERTRAASIRAAADMLEFVAKAKVARGTRYDLGKKKKETKPRASSDGPDFLMELAQLNAQFLNRVVKLVGSHRSTAHRVLERFYAQLVPATFDEGLRPPLFSRAGARRTIHFENRSLKSARALLEITWKPLQGPRPSRPIEVEFEFEFTPPAGGQRRGKGAWQAQMPYGERVEIAVLLPTLPDGIRRGRVYTTELELTLGDRTQYVPVAVEREAR